MRRLIFNIFICVLALVLVFVNGIRLYSVNGQCDFTIATVERIDEQEGSNGLNTVAVRYNKDSYLVSAEIADVPEWVISQINEKNEMVVYFHNGDFNVVHAVPYSPLQDMMLQSTIIYIGAFVILIIGNSFSWNKRK